ncbi:MAG: 2-oxo acid dehydrogenase subunit E2 [Theionarchaea archaeon]|nr:2-oxo acid dehydrogenase subunit E2 [Theionarchaea archaeon]
MKMVMPKMGMTMEEGTIVEWKKKDGEYVEKGEIILEIMTNKVSIDVEAPSSGYLKVLKDVDDVVPVGEVIAVIEESLEAEKEVPVELKEVPVIREEVPVIREEVPVIREEVPVIREEVPFAKAEVTGGTEIGEVSLAEGRIPASPRARMLAEEKGISLEDVAGTGPDGVITEKDVLRKIEGEHISVSKPLPKQELAPEPEFEPTGAVSPLAERIAREKGVDLSKVKGTGIGGKITKEDVLKYIEKGFEPEIEKPEIEKPEITVAKEEVLPERVVPPVIEPGPEVEPTEVPSRAEPPVAAPQPEITLPEAVSEREKGILLTGIKKLTAEKMIKSKREAPHLTLGMEVDMTEASKLKDSLNVSYTDILVKAVAQALRNYPLLNSTLSENRIILRDHINIGIAVARGEDLIVPVIHDADRRSVKEISRLTKDIIQRTREDQLTEKDVLNGTFTISNLGMYDIDFFTPIINPPEAAILGVGKIQKKPVVIHDQIRVRERVNLSLSFDHRIVNGMPASLFLKEIKILLENPYKLLVEGEP